MDMEAAMKRIPPHSAEAEQAVLGAMLMNKEAITVASEILSGDDFIRQHMESCLILWWNCFMRENRSI